MAKLDTSAGKTEADPMVSAKWLAAHLGDKNVIAIDSTWCMPGSDMPHPDQFIPGPHFDIDVIADPDAAFSHTLPSPDDFQAAVREMGVNKDSLVICYDRHGLMGAPRVWWMFRAMGHDNVKVLDGGLPAWLALGQDVVSAPSNGPRGDFIARFRPGLVKSKAGVLGALGTCQILDARAKGRFDGTAPEPRKGLSSGHMPGAMSTPFGSLKTDDGFLKSKAELADIFEAAGFNADSPAITSCGSGVTACGIALALARLGVWDAAVYDGSWVEWASDPTSPIDTINSESAP